MKKGGIWVRGLVMNLMGGLESEPWNAGGGGQPVGQVDIIGQMKATFQKKGIILS